MMPIKAKDAVYALAGEQHGTVAKTRMVAISFQSPPDVKLYTGEPDRSS